MSAFSIDPDIRKAETIPARIYRDEQCYALSKDRVFARTWHCIGHEQELHAAVEPVTLLEGCLDEPLLLSRAGNGETRLLSNVCTHRGMLVATESGSPSELRCRYHGRSFDLAGRFTSMPEFEDAADFPGPDDDLAPASLFSWHGFLFASLDPLAGAEQVFGPVEERVGFLPLGEGQLDPSARDYVVPANWMLYCDNYLEGFHIPYVHTALAPSIDYTAYRTELFAWGSVQISAAASGVSAFDFPTGHPDHGQRVGGYYFWFFPGTLLNFYPWGVSLNFVQPLGPALTRVRFRAWVWDPDKRNEGVGTGLHEVELEDEAIVESVQAGMQSRLYKRGRYSPRRERGVHHFHRLLAAAMQG